MKCRKCGRGGLRSTVTVQLVEGDKLVGARVCGVCAKKAMKILPAEAATVCSCGAPAITCGKCVDRKAKAAKLGAANAHDIAKQLLGRAKMHEMSILQDQAPETASYLRGLSEGLENAAHFVKQGCW